MTHKFRERYVGRCGGCKRTMTGVRPNEAGQAPPNHIMVRCKECRAIRKLEREK